MQYVEDYDIILSNLFLIVFYLHSSASGTSAVAIDNKIEQAMVCTTEARIKKK